MDQAVFKPPDNKEQSIWELPRQLKYSRFSVVNNILFNKINIVHNATLHTLALFSRVMRLYKPMDTGVSEVFEVGEKYFFVCGLGWASL